MDKHITKGLDIFKLYDPMISLRSYSKGELWWKISVYCPQDVSEKHRKNWKNWVGI